MARILYIWSVIRGIFTIAVLVLVGLTALAFTFGEVVSPGQIGIRQISFGPWKGFSDRGLEPGYHWSVPFYSRIDEIPQTVQLIHFDRSVRGSSALDVQASDGATVKVELSVLARFFPERGVIDGKEHGGPSELIRNLGVDPERWRNNIQRIVGNELRRTLGNLTTSDFYNPFLREKEVAKAFEQMIPQLLPVGIGVEGVLVRRYTYTSDRINTAIFQKNLQVQEEGLNEAASKLAEARAKLEQVSAEADAKIKTLLVTGESRSKVTVSEGSLYEAEKKAAGDLLVAKAQAEVDKLRASALAQAATAEVYVARELAPILSSLKGGVVSGVDPYNLELWMKRLGVSQK